MPYVRLSHAGRIHYAERGDRRKDRPSALLIHGAGASSAIWSMVLPRLARTTHTIAIDLPAHGPSSGDGAALDGSTDLSLARYRDAVGELAGTLCLGPSVLVGHSLGALVALAAAAAWPDKVRSLILCAASPRLPVPPELAALLRDDPAGVPAWLADHGLSPQAKPAVRRGFLATAGEITPTDITRADFEIVERTDATETLAHVRCPIVWIDGADDRIVPAVLATDGRRGEIVTVASAGHLIPIEAPAAIAAAASAAVGP